MAAPRVSIMIPNFNNGRESSKSGQRDFIGDLLASLRDTLEDDPTPFEILVHDDGSTDASLATCREWATRRWPSGEPFLDLVEDEHCGYLSRVANKLAERASGEFCVRLDGDIVCLTPQWVSALCRIFDEGPPDLGIVGPKQLLPDGRVHALGDWILHPRGNHHVAQGAERDMVTRSIEVDHVMGCFYCHRRKVWEDVGGYDETFLRGQTEDLTLMARMRGWRVFAVPTIEFIHHHGDRNVRETKADTASGLNATLDRFQEKWGFDRLAPDLDEVERRYAGTNLLWNEDVFGPRAPWPCPAQGPLDIAQTEWGRFAADQVFQRHIGLRLKIVQEVNKIPPRRRRFLHVHSRAGLLCHLLARDGESCIGVDPDPHYVDLATRVARSESYPADEPQFLLQPDSTTIPLDDGSVDAALLLDVVESHHNPVGLFKEINRVLEPRGMLVVVTQERRTPFEAGLDGLHPYRTQELKLQLKGSRCFVEVGDAKLPQGSGLIVSIAVRREMGELVQEAPEPVAAAST